MKPLRHIVPNTDAILDTDEWERKGHAKGSNPGGTFRDHKGKDWYVKQSISDDHAKNEFLANKLYQHLGVPTLDHQLITHSGGKLGTASPIVKIKNFDPYSNEDKKAISQHLGAHALLANWDSVGDGQDNQAHTEKGMTTLDAGGALNYRARGGPKGNAFGNEANEFETFRDKNVNRQTANVFGGMSPHELVKTVHPVAALRNSTIHDLVHTHGPGNHQAKTEMTNKLINRKKDLIGRANSIAKKHGIEMIKDVDEET
jgi:hypothetical protein